jgi:AcrR family transcriptional regulator
VTWPRPALPLRLVGSDKSDRILHAARRLLVERGHSAVTVAEIAREAQVSRGLLHYYFASKEDIVARVVRANVEASLSAARDLFTRATDSTSLANSFVEAYISVLEVDPSIYTMNFEAFVQGRRHPAVASELAELYQSRRAAVSEGLRDAAHRGIIAKPRDPEGLATALIAIADGLALQALADPTTPRAGVKETASRLLAHVLETAP